jgi:ligand-binding SRPBCC domain-containing protein
MRHVLAREQSVSRPRHEVFAFFADAANLERITPSRLRFAIQTPLPIAMRPGAIIDYRLSLFGVPFRWHTVIEVFEPETRFIDVQASGPYALWRHLHEFVDAPGGGTLIRDRVEYQLPLGPVGELAHALFVRRQLETIFDYRRRVIEAEFAASPS